MARDFRDRGGLQWRIEVPRVDFKNINAFSTRIGQLKKQIRSVKGELAGLTKVPAGGHVPSFKADTMAQNLEKLRKAYQEFANEETKQKEKASARAQKAQDLRNKEHNKELARRAKIRRIENEMHNDEVRAANKKAAAEARAAEKAADKKARAAAAAKKVRRDRLLGILGLNKALKQQEGHVNRVAFTFRRLFGILAAFTIARRSAQAFGSMLARMVTFNRQLEVARLGIAALIVASGDVTNAFGETLTPAQALPLAQQEAVRQSKLLRREALTTQATFQQLLSAFQVSVAPGLAAGGSLDEIRKFTVQISQAAATLGLEQNQLAEEIRSIVQGTINIRTTRIAAALGITNADIRNAKEAGRLFEFLNKEFSAFTAAGDVALTTFEAIFANLKGSLDEVLAEGGRGFFIEFKETLDQLRKSLVDINAETGDLEINPKALKVAQILGDSLQKATKSFRGLMDADNYDQLIAAATTIGKTIEITADLIPSVVKGVGDGLGDIINVAKWVKRVVLGADATNDEIKSILRTISRIITVFAAVSLALTGFKSVLGGVLGIALRLASVAFMGVKTNLALSATSAGTLATNLARGVPAMLALSGGMFAFGLAVGRALLNLESVQSAIATILDMTNKESFGVGLADIPTETQGGSVLGVRGMPLTTPGIPWPFNQLLGDVAPYSTEGLNLDERLSTSLMPLPDIRTQREILATGTKQKRQELLKQFEDLGESIRHRLDTASGDEAYNLNKVLDQIGISIRQLQVRLGVFGESKIDTKALLKDEIENIPGVVETMLNGMDGLFKKFQKGDGLGLGDVAEEVEEATLRFRDVGAAIAGSAADLKTFQTRAEQVKKSVTAIKRELAVREGEKQGGVLGGVRAGIQFDIADQSKQTEKALEGLRNKVAALTPEIEKAEAAFNASFAGQTAAIQDFAKEVKMAYQSSMSTEEREDFIKGLAAEREIGLGVQQRIVTAAENLIILENERTAATRTIKNNEEEITKFIGFQDEILAALNEKNAERAKIEKINNTSLEEQAELMARINAIQAFGGTGTQIDINALQAEKELAEARAALAKIGVTDGEGSPEFKLQQQNVDAAQDALTRLQMAQKDGMEGIIAGMQLAWDKFRLQGTTVATEIAKTTEDLIQGTVDILGNAFVDLFTEGTTDIRQMFADLFADIARDLAKSAIMQTLIAIFGGGSNGGQESPDLGGILMNSVIGAVTGVLSGGLAGAFGGGGGDGGGGGGNNEDSNIKSGGATNIDNKIGKSSGGIVGSNRIHGFSSGGVIGQNGRNADPRDTIHIAARKGEGILRSEAVTALQQQFGPGIMSALNFADRSPLGMAGFGGMVGAGAIRGAGGFTPTSMSSENIQSIASAPAPQAPAPQIVPVMVTDSEQMEKMMASPTALDVQSRNYQENPERFER